MKAVCISDTHGNHGQVDLPGGDILIHAGDFTRFMHRKDDFLEWFVEQPHDKKVLTLGNHETMGQSEQTVQNLVNRLNRRDDLTFIDLDSATVNGQTIGAPMVARDVDIMLSHVPPLGILDAGGNGREDYKRELIRNRPKLYVFGHIHTGYGREEQGGTTFVNASLCVGDQYDLVNEPITIDLEELDK